MADDDHEERSNTATDTDTDAVDAALNNRTAVSSSDYTFFLNIVVLNHMAGTSHDDPSPEEKEQDDEKKKQEENTSASNSEPEPSSSRDAPIDGDESPDENSSPSTNTKDDDGGDTTVLSKDRAVAQSPLDDLAQRMGRLAPRVGRLVLRNNAPQAVGRLVERSLRSSVRAASSASRAAADRASTFVASRTMLGRASYALNRALPELVAETGLDGLRVARRSHSASGSGSSPVMVVQVDLRPSQLPEYVAAVAGEDAAAEYRAARSSLRRLGAPATEDALEREMLPRAREGLMTRFSTRLVEKMRAKDESLEVHCVALREAEEARWLFTFLEFQTQMK